MSGVWRKTLVYLGLVEEPEEHDDTVFVEQEEPVLATAEVGGGSVGGGGAGSGGTIRPLRVAEPGAPHVRAVASAGARVGVVQAMSFDDAEQVGSRYRLGQPVLLDLSGLDPKTGRRLLDFVSGVIYALRGAIKPAGDRAFLLVPDGIEVPPEERRRLADMGYTTDA